MTFNVLHGDMLLKLPTLEANSIDAVITDPPYEIGFMGKSWDSTGIAFSAETWRQVLRVLKPGGHMACFGGSRTVHRMACAIEDAGFELRDTIMWLYGSGFPKSLDVSKAIDKAAGAERKVIGRSNRHSGTSSSEGSVSDLVRYGSSGEFITAPATLEAAQWSGWGTALKPAHEPIILARKPLIGTVAANVLAHGTGGINVGACRVSMGSEYDPNAVQRQGSNRQTWEGGINSGLAPDHVQQTYNAQGRWPANVCHDGSDEVMAAFAAFGERTSGSGGTGGTDPGMWSGKAKSSYVTHNDFGSPARFFYCAKANKQDRAGSQHPTVKPLALMRWLCNMITPEGGTILDPFAGSGTTLQAAIECGFDVVGVEQSEEYHADIVRRITPEKPDDTGLEQIELFQ